MSVETANPEVSVIIPARNEGTCLAACLSSLGEQTDVDYEIIVVDDHSTDNTRALAENSAARVIAAPDLPAGWTGKCNAAWCGARAANGKWLLFTDADTRHQANSIASGLEEARANGAALLSYSPRQEVQSLAERALMPLIFAELARTYPPKDVCDPNSPVAAANGQYLLISREAYDKVGGHAAVASSILEDVGLAKLVKGVGLPLHFRMSDVVSTRMYSGFHQLWEGWTKNLALLLSNPRGLAWRRALEFTIVLVSVIFSVVTLIKGEWIASAISALVALDWLYSFWKRVSQAHFDGLSNILAIFGLPLYALLLLNSDISHKRGFVRWKDREYSVAEEPKPEGTAAASS